MIDVAYLWICQDVQWSEYSEFPETYHEPGIDSRGIEAAWSYSHCIGGGGGTGRARRKYSGTDGGTVNQNVVVLLKMLSHTGLR